MIKDLSSWTVTLSALATGKGNSTRTITKAQEGLYIIGNGYYGNGVPSITGKGEIIYDSKLSYRFFILTLYEGDVLTITCSGDTTWSLCKVGNLPPYLKYEATPMKTWNFSYPAGGNISTNATKRHDIYFGHVGDHWHSWWATGTLSNFDSTYDYTPDWGCNRIGVARKESDGFTIACNRGYRDGHTDDGSYGGSACIVKLEGGYLGYHNGKVITTAHLNDDTIVDLQTGHPTGNLT